MRSRSLPFWISLALHGIAFGLAAVLFVKPPQFAMDTGHNSVEVHLVAAGADPLPTPPPPPALSDVQPPPLQPPPPIAPPKPQSAPTAAKGDSSAPKPGKDAVTATSDGGAILEAKPDYLSNPPPDYPAAARRAREEGLAVLQVVVGTDGRPETVSMETGSGFSDLDQAALAAVRRWRFRPALMGSLKVKSRVTIPIRFRLDG